MDFLHIIAKPIARARAMRHYFTGKPCRAGHVALRTVKSSRCIACHREGQALARRQPGAAERRAEYDRERFAANPDYFREKSRAYYSENRERVNAQKRGYWAENRDRMAKARKTWAGQNAWRIRHLNSKRKKQIRLATPQWADLAEIANVYRDAARLSSETGERYWVDHIVPLKGENVCGLHVHYNLRPLHWLKNIRKKNKF